MKLARVILLVSMLILVFDIVTTSISFAQCPPYLTFTGEALGDFFGYSVSGAGDVNNDGSADLIVGAQHNDAGGDNAGGAYVYSGGRCNLAGDANNDGSVNIADVTFLIARIFAGGAAPPCCQEGDANGDGSVNIADVTFLIARIFAGGPVPLCGPLGMGC